MAQPATGLSHRSRDTLFRHIVHALDEMPSDLREVFILSHYEHLPTEEIALQMHRKPGELASLMGRANAAFFQHLHEPDPGP